MVRLGPESRKQLRAAGRFALISAELTGLSCGFALVGYWADRTWDTSPYLTVTGLVVGAAAAIKRLLDLRHYYKDLSPPDVDP